MDELLETGNPVDVRTIRRILGLPTPEIGGALNQLYTGKDETRWTAIAENAVLLTAHIAKTQTLIEPKSILRLASDISENIHNDNGNLAIAKFLGELKMVFNLSARVAKRKMLQGKRTSARTHRREDIETYKEIRRLAKECHTQEEAICKYQSQHPQEHEGSLGALRRSFYRIQKEMHLAKARRRSGKPEN